jgi:hypothetical protein
MGAAVLLLFHYFAQIIPSDCKLKTAFFGAAARKAARGTDADRGETRRPARAAWGKMATIVRPRAGFSPALFQVHHAR